MKKRGKRNSKVKEIILNEEFSGKNNSLKTLLKLSRTYFGFCVVCKNRGKTLKENKKVLH